VSLYHCYAPPQCSQQQSLFLVSTLTEAWLMLLRSLFCQRLEYSLLVDDSVPMCGESHKRKALDTSESSRSSKHAANQHSADDDNSTSATVGVFCYQQCEQRIGELVLKQGVLERWLKVFVDESAVKRESIVLKFGRVKEELESAERAALAAYDEEVRRVVKSCEVECESVEVLSQQLSACVLACGAGIPVCDGVGDSECVDKEGSESVRSVNVALCEEGLCEVLERCWSLVSVSSGDSDEAALRMAEAEVSVCDYVSDEVVWCRVVTCDDSAVMFRQLQVARVHCVASADSDDYWT
jgi:hypothetical protein